MSRNSKRISVGRQLSCQSLCAENGPPSIFLPPLKQTLLTPKFQLHELGEPSPNAPRKTIVIVGATGSGKSTLINGLFNHVVGVSWEDQFRFRLVQETSGNQAKSQTQRVTVYTVHHRKGHAVPYTLTVVDTPGFGDTAGVLKDNKIADQLRAFFNSADKTGINRIDAVGFVVQASLPRLTVSQQYTFDSILALFGKDIAKNIYFLITFADARTPQVMSGILEAKLPHEGFFKFNNSVLFTCKPKEDASQHDASDDEEDDSEFNEIYWKMGTKSYKSFLDTLGRTESRSLEQTQAVIQERRTLELCVRGLQTEIRLGMNKLEQLEEERAVLAQLEGEMERTRDSTYTVHEESVEAVPVTAGQYTTNCTLCKRTCHERCSEPEDAGKRACAAMSGGDRCTVCPGKCHWSSHSNQPYVYRVRRVAVTRRADDLWEKYTEAKSKVDALKGSTRLQQELDGVERTVLRLVEAVRGCQARLERISLAPGDPASTADYIDLQISVEQSEAEPGWQWRVKQLQKLKQQAQYKMQVKKGSFEPFLKDRPAGAAPVLASGGGVGGGGGGGGGATAPGDENEDDDQYRHPTIEKIQQELGLNKLFARRSCGEEEPRASPSVSIETTPEPEPETASEPEIRDEQTQTDDQPTEAAEDKADFRRKLQLQLSKRLSSNS